MEKSHMDEFSSATCEICGQMSLLRTKCTCSLASEDGHSPSESRNGKDRSGLSVAPVSRSAQPDEWGAWVTSGTCGPLFEGSSPSAALQQSLESRLRAALDVNGSPEYELTWKHWDMPSGLPICALRASARHTSGKVVLGGRRQDQERRMANGGHRIPKNGGAEAIRCP